MNKKGFTLIELLIVVAIIGILAAIAVPAYIGQQLRAVRTEGATTLKILRLLGEQVYADTGSYLGANAADTDALKAALPGFKPGDKADLNYNYSVVSTATTFIATATPKAHTKPANVGDGPCTLNQDNVKGGPCW